ncbi:hypothetical protein ACVILI_005894 [Mesorhizobium sp. USDA 4775]
MTFSQWRYAWNDDIHDHRAGQNLRMVAQQGEYDLAADIMAGNHQVPQPASFGDASHQPCQGPLVAGPGHALRATDAGQVGGDDPVVGCQPADHPFERVGALRPSMQQEECRRFGRTRLADGNAQPFDFDGRDLHVLILPTAYAIDLVGNREIDRAINRHSSHFVMNVPFS